ILTLDTLVRCVRCVRSINKDCLYRGGIGPSLPPTHTPHIVSQGFPFYLRDLEGVTRANNGRDTEVLFSFGPTEATEDRRKAFGMSVIERSFRHLEDFEIPCNVSPRLQTFVSRSAAPARRARALPYWSRSACD